MKTPQKHIGTTETISHGGRTFHLFHYRGYWLFDNAPGFNHRKFPIDVAGQCLGRFDSRDEAVRALEGAAA